MMQAPFLLKTFFFDDLCIDRGLGVVEAPGWQRKWSGAAAMKNMVPK